MPRTQNLNTYHYRVNYIDKDTDPDKELQRYFKTAKEACDFFSISKSTFYSYSSNNNTKESRRSKSNKIMKTMSKLENPLPVYEKIMVHFD